MCTDSVVILMSNKILLNRQTTTVTVHFGAGLRHEYILFSIRLCVSNKDSAFVLIAPRSRRRPMISNYGRKCRNTSSCWTEPPTDRPTGQDRRKKPEMRSTDRARVVGWCDGRLRRRRRRRRRGGKVVDGELRQPPITETLRAAAGHHRWALQLRITRTQRAEMMTGNVSCAMFLISLWCSVCAKS